MSRERDAASGEAWSLRNEHAPLAVRRRLQDRPPPSYLHDFIYGAIDGTVITFGVVAGVEEASLDQKVDPLRGREGHHTLRTAQTTRMPVGVRTACGHSNVPARARA
jgi:hypothetical protein